jgi:hypothetical protein
MIIDGAKLQRFTAHRQTTSLSLESTIRRSEEPDQHLVDVRIEAILSSQTIGPFAL